MEAKPTTQNTGTFAGKTPNSLRRIFKKWLNARKEVESLLNPTKGTLYRFHTNKVINSLADCVKNNMED